MQGRPPDARPSAALAGFQGDDVLVIHTLVNPNAFGCNPQMAFLNHFIIGFYPLHLRFFDFGGFGFFRRAFKIQS